MESYNSKILLFGEYSVLRNSMALVIPCDRYSGKLDFCTKDVNNKYALQSNEYLKKFSNFIAGNLDEHFVLEVKRLEWEIENGLFFESTIPQGYGLGSSGALVAAIFLRYLKKAKSVKDDLKVITFEKIQQLRAALAKLESFFHGTSSGLDPLSIILNTPILYKNANDIVTTPLPPANALGKNVIFLLNTKISRSTAGLMQRFDHLQQDERFRRKFIEELVPSTNESIDHFLKGDTKNLYKSVHGLSLFQLDEMSDFIPEALRKEMAKGLDHGDYSLKLCGAGGGGFMLGFTEHWEKTLEELKDYEIEPIYQY